MKKIAFLLLTLFCVISSSEAKKPKKKKTEYVITVSTNFGEMVCLLYSDTPKHKSNFIKLAREGFYDSTTFHRVIKNFMIQGGDPLSKDNNPMNDGQGGPKYTIPAEIKENHTHVKGAICAARRGDMVNPKKESSGSQFYIVHNENGTPHLDGAYTVFGEVIKGIEIVDLIANQPTGQMNRPESKITMSVKVEVIKLRKIKKRYGVDATKI